MHWEECIGQDCDGPGASTPPRSCVPRGRAIVMKTACSAFSCFPTGWTFFLNLFGPKPLGSVKNSAGMINPVSPHYCFVGNALAIRRPRVGRTGPSSTAAAGRAVCTRPGAAGRRRRRCGRAADRKRPPSGVPRWARAWPNTPIRGTLNDRGMGGTQMDHTRLNCCIQSKDIFSGQGVLQVFQVSADPLPVKWLALAVAIFLSRFFGH